MIKNISATLPKILPILLIIGLIIFGYIRWGGNTNFSSNSNSQASPTPTVTFASTPQVEQTITTPQAVFYTKAIIPDLSKTFVLIPYKLDQPYQEMWLTLKTKPGTPEIIILIDHPILEKINWSHISEDRLTLYQKNPQYQSLDDFLSSPPTETVIMDPHLAYQKRFEQLNSVPLSTEIDASQYNYFLTTHTPPQTSNGFTMYQTIIDASNGSLDENQQLFWKIDAPGINPDNKLYLGEIHVDYRQTSEQD